MAYYISYPLHFNYWLHYMIPHIYVTAMVGHVNLTWVIWVALAYNSHVLRTKFMPSIECSIMAIDQYYENNHYYATMQAWKRIWWFLVSIVLIFMWLKASATQITHVRLTQPTSFWSARAHAKGWKCKTRIILPSMHLLNKEMPISVQPGA